jgi:hypothetical protein
MYYQSVNFCLKIRLIEIYEVLKTIRITVFDKQETNIKKLLM